MAGLDAACFGNAWSVDVYRQELVREYCQLRVLEHGSGLGGWSCTWIVADEAHLLRIAIAPPHRRHGLGRQLLAEVLREVGEAGCTAVLLEVAAANQPARALYEAFEFETIGVRSGYYTRPPDDAVVMRCPLARSRPPLG